MAGSSPQGAPTSLFDRFLDRYERVVGWPTGRKVFLLTSLALAVHLLASTGLRTAVSHSSRVGGFFDPAPLIFIRRAWFAWLVPFFLVCLWRMRSKGEERWLAHVLIWLYAFTVMLLFHAWGQITTAYFFIAPMLTLFAAIAFDTRIGWWTYFLATLLTCVMAAVDTLGLMPYARAFLERTLDSHTRAIYYVPVLCVSWAGFSLVFLLVQATTASRARLREAIGKTYGELARAKDSLARSKALSIIAGAGAAAAHELGNPLASSGALLQLLREDLPASIRDRALPLIERILAREKRISEVVHRLQKETDDVMRHEAIGPVPPGYEAESLPDAVRGPASLRSTLAERYETSTDWPLARKAFFMNLVLLPLALFMSTGVSYAWKAGIADNLLDLNPLVWLLWGYVLWLGLSVAAARFFIVRNENSRLPAYLSLIGVFLLSFGLLRLFGTVSSAVFAILPGLLICHLVFLDTRIGWAGWAGGTATILLLAWGDISGAWHYAPLFRLRQIDDQLAPVFYLTLLATVWTSFTWAFVQVQLAERLRISEQQKIEEATRRLATAKEDLAQAEGRAAAGSIVMELIPKLLGPLQENEPDLRALERELAAVPGGAARGELDVLARILKAEARAATMAGQLEKLSVPVAGAPA
ncbi:MAG: hypothetical protein KIT79_00025 [Deltaproteobacteria bacterium]|nr:hypothetical protein [Deltaproteobacteria bacterium]